MDQKLMAHFEVTKNDRVYRLEVQAGAPLGEVYDALHEMLMHTVELSKKAAEQAKPVVPEVQAEVVS